MTKLAKPAKDKLDERMKHDGRKQTTPIYKNG